MLRRISNFLTSSWTTLLLFGAIVTGSLVGLTSSSTGATLGNGVDLTVLGLIFLLFFGLRLQRFSFQHGDGRFVLLAWCTNFLIVPAIGFLIASMFLAGKPLFFTGVIIYFMAPCTDWFLGFTRLAHGNTRLGSLLIPVNMATQLLLYPVYLTLFTQWHSGFEITIARDTLLQWFVIPLLAARALHLVLQRALPTTLFASTLDTVARVIPFVIAVLVVQIFAANIPTIADHLSVVTLILAAVFVFFITTYVMGDWLSRHFRLSYPDRALLAMITAARNAPLMLGVTVVAIPNEPLVYAAIIIGMLVEFPHLATLTKLLDRQRRNVTEQPGTALLAEHRHRSGLDVVAVPDG
ncbi:MAG: arsenic resistance protein [Chloroflexia bacterium]|nr:arsenic resistance protein [Chloroflexia bacterium]